MTWDELDYWQCGEWQAIEERLDELSEAGVSISPKREYMFRSLDATPYDGCRVAIIGQDPYPNASNATGLAFEVPKKSKELPPTLRNIFTEYVSDLHYPYPPNGSLEKWAKQGVLLWNAYPTCEEGKPLSHHWDEWTWLTKEIVEKLDKREKPVVFVFLGREAQKFSKYVTESDVIETSHPSKMGANYGFFGSRLFSTINGKCAEAGIKPINWRLDNGRDSQEV